MSAPRCYTFSTGAILISRRQKLGTLLDTINLVKNNDKNLVEPLAIYIMADILGKTILLVFPRHPLIDALLQDFLIFFIKWR